MISSEPNPVNSPASDVKDDDPLIEIPSLTGTELIKKSQVTGIDIRSMVVRCTICRSQINHLDYQKVKQHRLLNVIVCKECFGFYGNEEFTRDEAGKYNYCTWCGNGGKLFVCDFCPNVFCSNCVRLNFGRAEVAIMQKDGWKCYVCDPSKLKNKVAYCNMILEFSKSRHQKLKKSEQENKELISEKWVLDAFNKTENACKSLIKKMDKLKHVEVSRSKSLKHIIKKMEEVVSMHKTELGHVLKNLSDQYEAYLKDKQAEEKLQTVKSIQSDSDLEILENKEDLKMDIDDTSIKNEGKEKSSYTNGIKSEESSKKVNGIEAKNESSKDDINSKLLNENDQEALAKKELLKDSSEDSEMELEGGNITITAEVHSSENDVKRVEPSKPSKVSDSKLIKTSPSKNCAIKESSMSSLSSESDISSTDFDKPSRPQTAKMSKKKNQSKPSKEKCAEFDYVNDLKLKSPTFIKLESCDHLLNGETTIKLPAIYLLEELDKTMSNLMKEPIKKKISKKDGKEDKKPKIRKAVPKRFRKDSSSSITFSSDEEKPSDEDKPLAKEKKPVTIEDPEDQAKKELLKSDSSSDEDSTSDSVVEVKKSSKNKKTKVKSDSSDDFVPRKKKKYDKLLKKRLLSDESENENKKKSSEKSKRKRNLASEDDLKSDRLKTTESASTSDSDNEKKPKTKRRRRIKKAADSSTDAEKKPDNTESATPKKGRKDIKKIISKEDQKKETKEAQQAERERKKRIEEKQKLYNVITDTSSDGKEIITKKMVLEVDPVSKEELVQIHPDIIEKLKPHQVKGVKFMWECTIESLEDLKKKPGSGCILAHCMGLGKTLQVITFLHTCLTNPKINTVIKRAMVICPYNVVLNWSKEIDIWLSKMDSDEILVHEVATAKDNYTRLDILKYWHKEGGILIISYDIFRRLAANKIPKLRKSLKEELQRYLLNPGPDIVVCDEGHILKNEASAISKACSLLRTERRIVLTGTPLQNNLKEYHCMLSFVKPHLLGTSKEFRNRFVNPIVNGQYEDSNEYDVRRMKKRIHILHKLLEGCVQRCDYSALTKFLPPKHEFVISVKLSEIQIKMYRWYLENLSKAQGQDKIRGGTLFQDYNMLRNLCTHLYLAHISHERAEKRKFLKESEDEDEYDDSFIDDDSGSGKSKTSSGSDTDEIVKNYKTRSRRKEDDDDDDVVEEVEKPSEKAWYYEFISDEDAHKIELSGKIVLLMNILKECEAIGDKVIVFSQSLLTLDILEDILSHADESDEFKSSWIPGADYFRMDGGTSAEFRKQFIDMFNNPLNYRARLFLVSTRAGGLGTNLVGANRVVILDASWNPSHDVQAIFRVYRFGQNKPVYIYRLLAKGTMEEKIYDRQVNKLSLSIRVVDEQQIDRHFNSTELYELYTFEPESLSNRPTPMVPQDRLLAEMLIKYNDLIVSYHEHDSLLQNETEEDLTEEERKSAWTEFENEREGRSADDMLFDDLEISNFCREPDLSEADYSGQAVSDTKLIIETIIKSLRMQYAGGTPAMLRKKLLAGIVQIKSVFQEKHLKICRIKQEWVVKGSVPQTVNRYEKELSKVITELNLHYARVFQLVQGDNLAQTNPQGSNPPPQQVPPQPHQQYQMHNVRANVNMPGYQARFPFLFQNMTNVNQPQFAAHIQNTFVRTGRPPNLSRTTYVRAGFNPFTPSSTTSQPVITEAPPDRSDQVPQGSNSKSSVVIEEIE